ncbi:MAG: cupin domain-containing protein [Alphaproteobacteria bacterium]|nr:cupin domain-containing protein [Alphaproteobacteria bacterium]
MTDNWKPDAVRRVVTGHDNGGVARAHQDCAAQNIRSRTAGVASTLIWSTDAMPCNMPAGKDYEDMGLRQLGTYPPVNGTRFIVMQVDPGAPGAMHRTETLDYIAVLEGEIDMDMDDSTVTLRAGDTMVQRGTNHSWMNRSNKPAKLAIVLIDAQPLGIGHAVPRNGVAGDHSRK